MLNLSYAPATAAAVTPSDTADLSTPSSLPADSQYKPAVLYVGATGDLRVTTASGNTLTFKNVPVGFFPVQVTRVWTLASGTTATDIIAIWP